MKNKVIISRMGIIGLAVLMLSAAGCTFGKEEPQPSANVESQSQANLNIVEWNGKKYTYNTNLENILFLGIDQDEAFQEEYLAGDAGQADCIMLLSLNKETNQASVIQINRNTMAELDLYDLNGNKGGSQQGQLCLQYAYNIGGSSSCWSMVQTVRDVLFGLPIDGYFAMDMAGIPEINDALGGVNVTMNADYTMIHPDFAAGNTVHLTGELAERFVRYRDIDEFDSVSNRMERQVDYVTAMIGSLKEHGGSELYDILVPYLDTYIITDMDAEQMNALASYDYQSDQIQYLPGETIMGEKYEEYHLDDDALMDMIIETFYTEVE